MVNDFLFVCLVGLSVCVYIVLGFFTVCYVGNSVNVTSKNLTLTQKSDSCQTEK